MFKCFHVNWNFLISRCALEENFCDIIGNRTLRWGVRWSLALCLVLVSLSSVVRWRRCRRCNTLSVSLLHICRLKPMLLLLLEVSLALPADYWWPGIEHFLQLNLLFLETCRYIWGSMVVPTFISWRLTGSWLKCRFEQCSFLVSRCLNKHIFFLVCLNLFLTENKTADERALPCSLEGGPEVICHSLVNNIISRWLWGHWNGIVACYGWGLVIEYVAIDGLGVSLSLHDAMKVFLLGEIWTIGILNAATSAWCHWTRSIIVTSSWELWHLR